MTPRRRRDTIDPAVEQRVIELYTVERARLDEITSETGVARSSIYWILDKHGIAPDRQRSGSAGERPPEWALELIGQQREQIGRLKAKNELYRAMLIQATGRDPEAANLAELEPPSTRSE